MPNHVTNRIVVSGPIEDVAAFKKLMVIEDKQSVVSSIALLGTDVGLFDTFDFNQIIPQPTILDRVANPTRYGPHGRVMLFDHKDATTTDECREATEAEQAELNAVMKTTEDHPLSHLTRGVMPGWYDWRVSNWGTKWNAYDYQPIEDHARFEFKIDTAWSAPNPVYDELAKRFPTLGFDLAWFDEGWCHAGAGLLGRGSEVDTSEAFYIDPANTELANPIYERVYGSPPLSDEELEEEFIMEIGSVQTLRLADNFTCDDVRAVMDENGCYPLSSVTYSDDIEYLDDDDLYLIRQHREKIMEKLGIN